MKKYILLFGLFTATLTTSFAQPGKPSFGMRAGVTSSGISGDAVNSFNNLLNFSNGLVTTGNHTGFFAGSYLSIPVSAAVTIEPALYYTQKGYDLKGNLNLKGVEFLGLNARAALKSQYIDLPVLVKANLNGFQVFAGPQVSYLTNANLKTTAGVLGFNLLNTNIGLTEQLNRWDASLTGGVGYQFSNGLNVIASYDYGLSKTDANQSLRSYNRSIKVGIGMAF